MEPSPGNTEACPSDTEMEALLCDDGLSPERLEQIEDHLSHCLDCQSRLEDTTPGELDTSADFAPDTPENQENTQAIIRRIQRGGSRVAAPPLTEPEDFNFLPANTGDAAALGQIGKYRILSFVGRGGMGIVFRAEDEELHRTVAVKVLSPEAAINRDARERFLREARSAAAVTHENVLPIHDMGTIPDNGLPYLVLPFIEGETLADYLDRKGALSLEEMIRIGSCVASGLEAAHRSGLVHRDVKPANILIENETGRIYIADFGLARAVESGGKLTGTGMLMGTPQFMSPEQIEGGPVDHRSDLFSLGAILYLMATGTRPFSGDTPVSMMRSVVETNPPHPRKYSSDTPSWLNLLIVSLLEKDPERRPQDTTDVVTALSEEVAPRPVKRRSQPALWLSLAGIGVAAFGLYYFRNSMKSAPEPTREKGPILSSATPYHIGNRDFASLQEAIDAAESGDEIQIAANGALPVDGATIQDKALLVRAAPGFLPRLESRNPDSSILHTDSNLGLAGLHFVHYSPSPKTPLIEIDNGGLNIANCQISCPAAPPATSMILTQASNHLEVTNTVFAGPGCIAIGFRRNRGHLHLDNSIVWTRRGIRSVFLEGYKPPSFRVHRNILRIGETVYDFDNLQNIRGIEVLSEGNTILSSDALMQMGKSDSDNFSDHLKWSSHKDQIAVSAWLKSDSTVEIAGQDEWNSYWNIPDENIGKELNPNLFSWLSAYTKQPWKVEASQFRPTSPNAPQEIPPKKRPGIRFVTVGPGTAYDEWKETTEGKTWFKETRAFLK